LKQVDDLLCRAGLAQFWKYPRDAVEMSVNALKQFETAEQALAPRRSVKESA
jgi:hypothetical protein